jgi:hypothetical protein
MLEIKPLPCPGCGGMFAEVEGPTHRYMESSPGCWAAYGIVLAREYSDPAYFAVHRLTVDAYAAQHPGRPSPQSMRSVGLHLVRLCLLLELGLPAEKANDAMVAAAKAKHAFTWLEPPRSLGPLTVAGIVGLRSAAEHKQAVRSWALAVWRAWSPRHEIVRGWLPPQYSRIKGN